MRERERVGGREGKREEREREQGGRKIIIAHKKALRYALIDDHMGGTMMNRQIGR